MYVGALIIRNITYESTKRKYYDTFMRRLLNKNNGRSIILIIKGLRKNICKVKIIELRNQII